MPHTIVKLPDEPIIMVHSTEGKDRVGDMIRAINDIRDCLDQQDETVFLIVDTRDVSMSVDEVMQGAILAARGQNAMLSHRKIRERIFLLSDPMVRAAVRGLESATFGLLKARSFTTVEEALDYCRSQVAQLYS